MGKVKIKKEDVWIDMTPMSDVMTLLLTFFMLTSTFVKNEPVKVNTQIPIVLPTGPVKKVAAKTVMTFHNTSKQTTGTTSESDETEANRTRK